MRSEGLYINEKFQRPSDLQHSTLTTVIPRSPVSRMEGF